MVPVIVPFHAAMLACVYMLLAVRVIKLRQSERVAIGTGGNVRLERTVGVRVCFHWTN